VKKVGARRTIENALRRYGFVSVAGVDEVGRGCLAGPVMAGAVVLDPDRHIAGLADSKALTALGRDRLYEAIVTRSVVWAVSAVEPAEIDEINIHQATLRAMQRAVQTLAPLPDVVLVDAFRIPSLLMAQRGVIKGDRQCAAIAAASIVAKVTRDRFMDRLHADDPRYGFDRHKGYATADHLAAVARHGYSPVHRRSFRPPTLFDTIELFDLGPSTLPQVQGCREPSPQAAIVAASRVTPTGDDAEGSPTLSNEESENC
jgi:ribonuclease HII